MKLTFNFFLRYRSASPARRLGASQQDRQQNRGLVVREASIDGWLSGALACCC